MSEQEWAEERDHDLPFPEPARAAEQPGTPAGPTDLSGWAVPGVARPEVPLSPSPSPEVAAVQAAVAALGLVRAAAVSPEQALVDLAALLQVSAALARVRVGRL